MKTKTNLERAFVVFLSLLLSTGALSACSKAAVSGDGDNHAVDYEYSVSMIDIGLDLTNRYNDLVPAKSSFSGENIYLLYTTLFDADEDKENIQLIVVLDKNQNVIREIPYQADIENVSIDTFAAATDGSYWTEEKSKLPGSNDQFLRHYDQFGNLLLTVCPGDLIEGAGYGFYVAAVDSYGRVYITIDFGEGEIGRNSLALIDQSGLLVGFWNDFTNQLSVTILDDGVPIVYEFVSSATPEVNKNLYKITSDEDIVLLVNIRDFESEVGAYFQPGIFAGFGNEVYFESWLNLYRLSLDDMKIELIADWNQLENTSDYTPNLCAFRAETEGLMYGIVPCSHQSMTLITFEK